MPMIKEVLASLLAYFLERGRNPGSISGRGDPSSRSPFLSLSLLLLLAINHNIV
jgi:hypothetical protein